MAPRAVCVVTAAATWDSRWLLQLLGLLGAALRRAGWKYIGIKIGVGREGPGTGLGIWGGEGGLEQQGGRKKRIQEK